MKLSEIKPGQVVTFNDDINPNLTVKTIIGNLVYFTDGTQTSDLDHLELITWEE